MTVLLIEPFGGIAGDMFLAALLDLRDERFGLGDLEHLAQALLPGQVRLELQDTRRRGLRGLHLRVQAEGTSPPSRHLSDLLALLEGVQLSERVRGESVAVLTRLARAEAQVHGIDLEQVHFHEVGAVDTLIDVVGASLALERLDVERVFSSAPLLGAGSVTCAHGELPVPAPAVAELLRGREARRPASSAADGERTTPTGAALLCQWTDRFELPERFWNQRTGVGAGTRDSEQGIANLLRVELGSLSAPGSSTEPERREAWCMEVNLDDLSPEEVGHALGQIREAGALEAWSVAAHMKKDRPGAVLCALARSEQRSALEAAVFRWTSSLGVRWTRLERTECGREQRRVEVAGSSVRVTLRQRPQALEGAPFGESDLFPEHDDLVQAAESAGLTLREVRARAIEALMQSL
jgi:uncharacterized protein (TIGR00299 family) protein